MSARLLQAVEPGATDMFGAGNPCREQSYKTLVNVEFMDPKGVVVTQGPRFDGTCPPLRPWPLIGRQATHAGLSRTACLRPCARNAMQMNNP